jgi:hypothetical protein
MIRFRLRTLLILLVILPPLFALAWLYWRAKPVEPAAEPAPSPYEIIWDDYAPDVIKKR